MRLVAHCNDYTSSKVVDDRVLIPDMYGSYYFSGNANVYYEFLDPLVSLEVHITLSEASRLAVVLVTEKIEIIGAVLDTGVRNTISPQCETFQRHVAANGFMPPMSDAWNQKFLSELTSRS